MGFRRVAFANTTVRSTTGRIEIPQGNMVQTISSFVIGKNLLNHQFSASIRINRVLRVLLIYRCIFRFAISCTSAWKNDVLNPILQHSIQQVNRTDNIIIVIFLRFADAFSNIGKSSKMDHRINLVLIKHLLQRISIQQISVLKNCAFINCFSMAIY